MQPYQQILRKIAYLRWMQPDASAADTIDHQVSNGLHGFVQLGKMEDGYLSTLEWKSMAHIIVKCFWL